MTHSAYIYFDSFYHRRDPRAKIIFSLLFSIGIITSKSVEKTVLMALSAVILSLFSVRIKETLLNARRISVLLILIILFSPLQKREANALISIGPFMLLSQEGAVSTLMILSRFIGISFIYALLVETERTQRLVCALRSFFLPYSICLTISMTLNLIPSLSYRYREIRDSLSLRLKEGKRRESLMPILSALTLSALKSIPSSASMLEERGFSGKSVEAYRRLDKSARTFTEILLSAIIPLIFILW